MSNRPVRAVILDLDGVVYLEDRLLPGVAATVAELRARGVRVLFGTNNATLTRAGFARKLTRLGIPCRPAELMNAALAAATWLRRRYPAGARIFVFGDRGLAAELRTAGLVPVWTHTRAAFKALPKKTGVCRARR